MNNINNTIPRLGTHIITIINTPLLPALYLSDRLYV